MYEICTFLFLIEYCPSSTRHIIFISILKSWSAIFFSERESLCLRSPLSPTQWLQKVCRLWAKIGKHERKSQTSGKAFEWERCSSERDSRQLSRSECTIFLTWWAMLTFSKSVAGHFLLKIGSKRSERCMLLPKPLHGQPGSSYRLHYKTSMWSLIDHLRAGGKCEGILNNRDFAGDLNWW